MNKRVSKEDHMRAETVRAFGFVLNVLDPGSRQEITRGVLLAEVAWHRENARLGTTYSKLERRFLALIEQALEK